MQGMIASLTRESSSMLGDEDLRSGCSGSEGGDRPERRIVRRKSGRLALAIGAIAALLALEKPVVAASQDDHDNLSSNQRHKMGSAIMVDVNVPKEAELNKSVNLGCTWRFGKNNTLYSVKWYKDEHEFFSYYPSNDPNNRIKTFSANGVNVDTSSSNKTSVRVVNLSLNNTGQYKCEVSTEGPFYETNYHKGNLTVIALPTRGPEITGLSSQYEVGENLTANCTSWPSVPKARLQWTINNVSVPREYVIEHPPLRPAKYFQPSEGTPNSLGLRMELTQRHIHTSGNILHIRCFAYVGSRRFEAMKRVHLATANKQRLSAGSSLRSHASWPLCSMALLLMSVILTT